MSDYLITKVNQKSNSFDHVEQTSHKAQYLNVLRKTLPLRTLSDSVNLYETDSTHSSHLNLQDRQQQLKYEEQNPQSKFQIPSIIMPNEYNEMTDNNKKCNEALKLIANDGVCNKTSENNSSVQNPAQNKHKNTSRNILRRQQCALEPGYTNLNKNVEHQHTTTTSSINSHVNNLKKWRLSKPEHMEQSNDLSDSTNTHRIGFLRYPLRKAMSYVRPQTEINLLNKHLQNSLTLDRNLNSKSVSGARLNLHPADSIQKISKHCVDNAQISRSADHLLTDEVYIGENSDVCGSTTLSAKPSVKTTTDRKTKQRDILHLNELFANILPRPLSAAFRRPIGKCKSASPTTSPDRFLQNFSSSFLHEDDNSNNNNNTKLNKLNSNSRIHINSQFSITENHLTHSTSSTTTTTKDICANTTLPTRIQLSLWEQSFDQLLTDPDGLTQFYRFLKSEYSEENIEFWAICELYKHLPVNELGEQSQKIYRLYLAPQSPREVNLDSETRKQTILNMNNPTNETFNLAQQTIQGLMKKDSYQRYLRSSFYENLKQLVCKNYSSNNIIPSKENLKLIESNQIKNNNLLSFDSVVDDHKNELVLNKNFSSTLEEDKPKDFPSPVPTYLIHSPIEISVIDELENQKNKLPTNLKNNSNNNNGSSRIVRRPLLKYHTQDNYDMPESIYHDSETVNFYDKSNSQSIEENPHELPNSVQIDATPCSPKILNCSLVQCQLKQNISADI